MSSLYLKELINKRCSALVIGAGRSGIAATKLLLKKGAKVTLFDDQPKTSLGLENEPFLSIIYKNLPDLACFQMLILSPGVSRSHPLVKKALELNLPVLNEIDLATIYLPTTKMVGVTGTNGKSTSTAMIEAIFNQAGLKAIACGNFGLPLCELVLKNEAFDCLVIELSSFQLETIFLLQLDAALILNISPDHLDRYDNINDYIKAKFNIYNLLKNKDNLIINKYLIKNLPQDIKKYQIFDVIDFKYLGILGEHNQENASAAAHCAKIFDISLFAIEKGLKNFKPLPHRCEIIGQFNEITFINDSKGTNVEAVKMALSTVSGPVHLLLGGIDKGEDFACLGLDPNISNIYVYGRAKEKIAKDLQNLKPTKLFNDLNESVTAAINSAKAGDSILLSPGCSSYDQYNNFIERGEHFRSIVNQVMA